MGIPEIDEHTREKGQDLSKGPIDATSDGALTNVRTKKA